MVRDARVHTPGAVCSGCLLVHRSTSRWNQGVQRHGLGHGHGEALERECVGYDSPEAFRRRDLAESLTERREKP